MIISASISHAEGDTWWSGNIELDSLAAFQRVQINDPVSVELGGEIFSLIVDSKTIDRSGVGKPKFTVALVSPTAMLASPRTLPLEYVWNDPVYAQDAAEEAAGQAIQWDLVNWQITGGLLQFSGAYAIDVINSIAKAAGGKVETLPDGTLHVRPAFPVSVPDWDTATVDQVLTDTSDNLSCTEAHTSKIVVDKVLVRGYSASDSGFLSVEVNPYCGQATWYAGDAVPLLVFTGRNVSSVEALASAGYIVCSGQIHQNVVEQKLVFTNKNYATLDKPATSLEYAQWIGNSLGSLTLEDDGLTVTASNSGVAIALVRYTIRATAYTWYSPPSSTTAAIETISISSTGVVTMTMGMSTVPVVAYFRATTDYSLGIGEIFCQRGEGLHRGADISEPLLTSTEAKLARGRAELDSNSLLQTVSITCIHRPGFLLGQLVEVHDGLMGQSWRGKITSISHSASGAKLTTTLELQRNGQPAP